MPDAENPLALLELSGRFDDEPLMPERFERSELPELSELSERLDDDPLIPELSELLEALEPLGEPFSPSA